MMQTSGTLIFLAQKHGFFFETRDSFASQIVLSNLSILSKKNPYQGNAMPSFSPTSNKAYVEFRVGIKRHACFSYVAKSKAESKKKQVMQSDQEVQVCGNFWWMEDKLLCMNQLSYLFPLSLGTRAIFLFSLSLFFLLFFCF